MTSFFLDLTFYLHLDCFVFQIFDNRVWTNPKKGGTKSTCDKTEERFQNKTGNSKWNTDRYNLRQQHQPKQQHICSSPKVKSFWVLKTLEQYLGFTFYMHMLMNILLQNKIWFTDMNTEYWPPLPPNKNSLGTQNVSNFSSYEQSPRLWHPKPPLCFVVKSTRQVISLHRNDLWRVMPESLNLSETWDIRQKHVWIIYFKKPEKHFKWIELRWWYIILVGCG